MSTLIEAYRGFEIHKANPTGGKAGKGNNRTSTIQVREFNRSGGYSIKAQVRYAVGSVDSLAGAVRSAKQHIDKLVGRMIYGKETPTGTFGYRQGGR